MTHQKTILAYVTRAYKSLLARRRVGENLSLVLRVVERHFRGEVRMQKDIVEHMNKTHGWGNKTTTKYLQDLIALGILTAERDPKNHWTIRYRLSAEES